MAEFKKQFTELSHELVIRIRNPSNPLDRRLELGSRRRHRAKITLVDGLPARYRINGCEELERNQVAATWDEQRESRPDDMSTNPSLKSVG
jgi:hypothetical protein